MAKQEFKKTVESFGHVTVNDFIAEDEITVTITLNEYRDLIRSDATTQERIDRANESKYDRERENEALSAENAELKQELYELKKENEDLQRRLNRAGACAIYSEEDDDEIDA